MNTIETRGLQARLHKEQEKLSAVRQIAQLFAAPLDLPTLLTSLLGAIRELIDAERATLFLVHERAAELSSMITDGGQVAPIRLRLGEGVAGWVAQQNQAVNIEDAYRDPRFSPATDQLTQFRTQSILCVPMHDHRGQVAGVLQVLNKRGRAFDADDEALLITVAAHAGISIENVRLYRSVIERNLALQGARESLERRIEELDLLSDIDRLIGAATNVDHLVDSVLRRLTSLFDSEAGCILLRDEGTGDLRFAATSGKHSHKLLGSRVKAGAGFVGKVTLDKQAAITNHGSRNLICVPLIGKDAAGATPAMGAIELANKKQKAEVFDHEDVRILQLVAARLAESVAVQLERAARERSSRLSMIGQMMSSVMHDVNTPTTVISGYAQLMADEPEAEIRREYAATILKQCALMSAMTREVLQFAKGESQLLVHRVYVEKFAAELRGQLLPTAEGAGVTLRIEAKYRGTAQFDELKLFRVLHNLVRNAVQALSPGGTVDVTFEATADELVIKVADNGPGIAPGVRDRLFEAFASEGKAEGTGLGLAIVKRIVDAHHGTITCDSQPGIGTTFTISLPLAPAKA